MEPLAIASSLISAAAYDAEAQQLHVTFHTGARWSYGDAGRPFTPADAEAFAGASSAGQHFLQQIKGQFPERRL